MKSYICVLFFTISAFTLSAQDMSDFEKVILGVWGFAEYQGDNIQYSKMNNLENDKPGIKFLENGKLIIRQNSGWCGTPPINYKNFNGTWKFESQNKLIINYEYWGGTIEETWIINTISKDFISVRRIDYKDSGKQYWDE